MNRQIVHLSQTLVIRTKIPQNWRQQLPSLYSTVLNSEGQRLFGFLMSPQTVLMVPFWWPQFGKYCLGDRRWEEEREQHGERGWPAQRWTSASSHLLELALTPLCGSHFQGTVGNSPWNTHFDIKGGHAFSCKCGNSLNGEEIRPSCRKGAMFLVLPWLKYFLFAILPPSLHSPLCPMMYLSHFIDIQRQIENRNL